MIEALTACAFQLAEVASAIARRAADDDTAGFLAASAEFRHCFFAVRMGVRLAAQLRSGQPGAAPTANRAVPAERLGAVERPERPELLEPLEREREGDYEPVSLPMFLKSLGLAAAAAERRGEALPAPIRETTLPTLKGLLAAAKAEPSASPARTAGLAVLARPPAPRPAVDRSRLLSSAVTPKLRRRDSS